MCGGGVFFLFSVVVVFGFCCCWFVGLFIVSVVFVVVCLFVFFPSFNLILTKLGNHELYCNFSCLNSEIVFLAEIVLDISPTFRPVLEAGWG